MGAVFAALIALVALYLFVWPLLAVGSIAFLSIKGGTVRRQRKRYMKRRSIRQ